MKAARSNRAIPRSRRTPGSQVLPLAEQLEARKLLSADLTPAFIALPAMLPSGGGDQVTIDLANTGTSLARGPVSISLFASSDGSLGTGAEALAAIVKNVHLKAGASVSLPVQIPPTVSVPDGSYFLVATVSGSGVVSSTIVSSGPVAIVQPFVDLTSQIIKLPASAVQTGYRLSRLTVEVTNQGNVTAAGKVAIETYLSIDGKLDETAFPVNVSLPRKVRIPPGGSAKLTVAFSALPMMDPGQYYLLAQVNPGRAIPDRNALNDLSVSAVPVQVIRAPHHHGIDCYIVIDDTDNYVDTGDEADLGDTSYSPPPIDIPSDTGTPTTDPTPNPTPDPTTQQGGDSSGYQPPPDSTPDPTPAPTTDPTTQPSTTDTPSDGTGDVGSPDTGSTDDSSGDSTDDWT